MTHRVYQYGQAEQEKASTPVWLARGTLILLRPTTILENVPDTSDKIVLLEPMEIALPSDTAVWAWTTAHVVLNQGVTFQAPAEAQVRGYNDGEVSWLPTGKYYVVPRGTLVCVLEVAAGSTYTGPVEERPAPRTPPGEEAQEEGQPQPGEEEEPPAPPTTSTKRSWTPWVVAAAVALAGVGAVAAVVATRRRGYRGLVSIQSNCKRLCPLRYGR